ncbi:MAG: hypothetical protein JWM95_3833 [Gemmatimonadetes bacterium]|nr:hypothetical protein [Gemmatimonadota bacterium]
MHKTTKVYSAPKLIMTGTLVARTLGSIDGIELEADPTDPMPFVKPGI